MFKKLFGGDKGGGGGTSSSRPPAAPRANATQGTVDAIQKLGEVRLISFCKRILHQASGMCLPAPFTDLKWHRALPLAKCTACLLSALNQSSGFAQLPASSALHLPKVIRCHPCRHMR